MTRPANSKALTGDERSWEGIADGEFTLFDSDSGQPYTFSISALQDLLNEARRRSGETPRLELRMTCVEVRKNALKQMITVILSNTTASLEMALAPNEDEARWITQKDGQNCPGEKFWTRKSFRIHIIPVE